MGTICLQCGDRGFDNAFVYCVKCLEFAVHRYCLDELPKTLDEFVRWICDDCYSKEYPHTPRHYGKCRSGMSKQDVSTNEMTVVIGGDGSCQLPKSSLVQISGPMKHVGTNLKEYTKECYNDDDKSDPEGIESMGGDGSSKVRENPSVQLSGPIQYVDVNVKEHTSDCDGDKSAPEGIKLMGCDGSSELMENNSVQLSGPKDCIDVNAKKYTRGHLNYGEKSDPKDIELMCGDGSSELPEGAPMELSGSMNYVDMHAKGGAGGHLDDGGKSNSKDIELMCGDDSSELPESSSLQLSRPVGYVDVNIKGRTRGQFDNGDKSDPKDIELMDDDGSSEQPENPLVQLSGPMDYVDVSIKECARGHLDDGDKSNSKDVELMDGDGSSELLESVPVHRSGPMDYVDVEVKEHTRDRFDNGNNSDPQDIEFDDGDNSDPEDIEFDDGKIIPKHERIHLDFNLIMKRPRFTKEIGGIVAMRYKEPWLFYEEVPRQEVEVWWHRFQQKFWWDPKINLPMKKEFNRRCREFVVRHLHHAQRNNKKPSWIKEDQWVSMCKKWESKKKCDTFEANQNNPESDTGESQERSYSKRMKKHGTGAVPQLEEITNKSVSLNQSRVELRPSSSTTCDMSSSSLRQTTDEMTNKLVSGPENVGANKKGKVPRHHKKKKRKGPGLGPLARHNRYMQQTPSSAGSYVGPNKFVPRQDFDRLSSDHRNFFGPMSTGGLQFAPQMQRPLQLLHPPPIPQWGHPYPTCQKPPCPRCGRHHWRHDCNGNLLICRNCRAPGHFARECTEPRRSKFGSQASNTGPYAPAMLPHQSFDQRDQHIQMQGV